MRRSRWFSASCSLALLLATIGGCKEEPPPEGEGVQETGMNMVVGAVGQTDVAAFKFLINRVSCNGETVDPWSTEVVRSLNDLELNDKYVALGSSHAFADAFVVLNEGCYDVVALPLQADGSPSDLCTMGVYNNAQVVDGQTTEVVLVSQCNGQQQTGGLDQIVLINQPPVLVDGWFDPDKWVCHDDVQTLCLKFFDPNKDPVDILWQQVSGVPLEQGITFLSSDKNPDGTTTECVTWKHAGPGKVEFQAIGYDLFKNPNGPGNITFESYFQSLGLQTTSHDSLGFMAYGLYNPTTCPCDPNPEVPDGMDNDCNGLVDDYEEICGNGLDDDGDGLVDENATPEICDGLDNDCDGQIDENASPEVCDGLDNDCNGLPDDGLVEVCDGVDNDCDGLVDELAICQPDDDCDGLDDDDDGLIDEDACCPAPGGEVCDGLDNDCDGLVDELPTCNCDPAGLESVACNGYSQVGTYDDGSCGHYQQVVDPCSAQCGAPPAGQPAGAPFCLGADKYQPVTNGSCGTTNQLVQANAPECGGGGGGCTPGTFVGTFCQGVDLHNQYQNADCTTYSQLAQACSAQCGAPPAGQTVGAPYCQGYDQYQTYTNGSCGNTVQLVEANSPACGYSPCRQGGYVTSFCSGVAYYSTYTNADCSTYDQLVSPCGVLCAPPAGQQVGPSYCNGYDLYGDFTNGVCGTASQLVQACSAQCGAPPAGQPAGAPYCSGTDKVQAVSNGSCGTTIQIVEANAAECGYVAGCVDAIYVQASQGSYTVPETWTFTVDAPPSFAPNNPNLTAYLLDGIWDDCGSVGSYAAECDGGAVQQFSGNVQIGTGRSLPASLTDLTAPFYHYSMTIRWCE